MLIPFWEEKKLKKRLSIISVCVLLLVVGVFGFTHYTKPPVIKTSHVLLDFGKEFELNKMIETSDDVVSEKIIKGQVDNKKLGKQKIVVEVKNSHDITATLPVTVTVIDEEAPVIAVGNVLTAEAKQPFDLKSKIHVTDNVDGGVTNSTNLSSYHTDVIGNQTISISVKDSSGNESKKVITLNVVDTTKPVISAKDKEITEGGSINLKENVTATDTVDGDITKNVEISGNVDTKKAGKYSVTYKVKDKSNNEASVNTIVTVKAKPVVVQVQQASVRNVASATPTRTASSSSSNQYVPMMIYFNGKAVPYVNGGQSSGQSIIDHSRKASTWGGASVFSGTDGMNTHIIGHNPGNFTGIWNARTFVITDKNGTPFTYHVTRVYKVTDNAIGIDDKVDYYNRITGTGGGERVTFQTCLNSSVNYIIEAN
jgi:hypothetical protein